MCARVGAVVVAAALEGEATTARGVGDVVARCSAGGPRGCRIGAERRRRGCTAGSGAAGWGQRDAVLYTGATWHFHVAHLMLRGVEGPAASPAGC